MRHALIHHRSDLTIIATWAMFSRGLQPEFPPPVQQQLEKIQGPAQEQDSSIRDLTNLPWCSIDNDDSHDLDQLTVGQALAHGRVRLYVAVADVDALVTKGSPIEIMHVKTPLRSIPRHASSPCCRSVYAMT